MQNYDKNRNGNTLYIMASLFNLQINDNLYSILANTWKQLSVLPSAGSLYLKAKTQLTQQGQSL